MKSAPLKLVDDTNRRAPAVKLALSPGQKDRKTARRFRRLRRLHLPDSFRTFRLLLLRETRTVPVGKGRVPDRSHEPEDTFESHAASNQEKDHQSHDTGHDEHLHEEVSQTLSGRAVPVDDAVDQLPEHGADEHDDTENDGNLDEADQSRNRAPEHDHAPHGTDVGRVLERTLLPERPGTKPRHEKEEPDVPGFARKVHCSLPRRFTFLDVNILKLAQKSIF